MGCTSLFFKVTGQCVKNCLFCRLLVCQFRYFQVASLSCLVVSFLFHPPTKQLRSLRFFYVLFICFPGSCCFGNSDSRLVFLLPGRLLHWHEGLTYQNNAFTLEINRTMVQCDLDQDHLFWVGPRSGCLVQTMI